MSRPVSPLPSLPLWVALPLALLAEVTVIVAVTGWNAAPALSARSGDVIEVSLVGEATEPEPVAEVDPAPDPAPEPEPEPEPQPRPEPPEPPPELDDPTIPEPEPEPIVSAPPKPVPPAPPRPVAKPRPKPLAPAAAAHPAKPTAAASGREAAQSSSSHDQAATESLPVAYLNNPAPAYPRQARQLGQQGTVRLRVLVTAEGRAAEVQIAASSGAASLDEAAVRAVRRWRFTPAHNGGRANAAWVIVPVRFELRD